MTNVVEKFSAFDEAVSEYKMKQTSVVKSFVKGCIELGEILFKYREKMKAEGSWLNYCKAIDIHIAQANQQIRLYEYSLELAEKDVLGKVLTNRTKLNLFLSLDEEQKTKLLEDEEITEETTADEFREKIAGIKGEELDVDETPILEDIGSKSIGNIVEGLGTTSTVSMNSKVVSELVNHLDLNMNSEGFVKILVLLEEVKSLASECKTAEVTDIEKAKVITAIQESMTEIHVLLGEI